MIFRNLDVYQKISGLCFILSKLTNIFAAVVIFSSLADNYFRPIGCGMLVLSGFLLMGCILFAFISYSKEKYKEERTLEMIDELLENPKILNHVKSKL